MSDPILNKTFETFINTFSIDIIDKKPISFIKEIRLTEANVIPQFKAIEEIEISGVDRVLYFEFNNGDSTGGSAIRNLTNIQKEEIRVIFRNLKVPIIRIVFNSIGSCKVQEEAVYYRCNFDISIIPEEIQIVENSIDLTINNLKFDEVETTLSSSSNTSIQITDYYQCFSSLITQNKTEQLNGADNTTQYDLIGLRNLIHSCDQTLQFKMKNDYISFFLVRPIFRGSKRIDRRGGPIISWICESPLNQLISLTFMFEQFNKLNPLAFEQFVDDLFNIVCHQLIIVRYVLSDLKGRTKKFYFEDKGFCQVPNSKKEAMLVSTYNFVVCSDVGGAISLGLYRNDILMNPKVKGNIESQRTAFNPFTNTFPYSRNIHLTAFKPLPSRKCTMFSEVFYTTNVQILYPEEIVEPNGFLNYQCYGYMGGVSIDKVDIMIFFKLNNPEAITSFRDTYIKNSGDYLNKMIVVINVDYFEKPTDNVKGKEISETVPVKQQRRRYYFHYGISGLFYLEEVKEYFRDAEGYFDCITKDENTPDYVTPYEDNQEIRDPSMIDSVFQSIDTTFEGENSHQLRILLFPYIRITNLKLALQEFTGLDNALSESAHYVMGRCKIHHSYLRVDNNYKCKEETCKIKLINNDSIEVFMYMEFIQLNAIIVNNTVQRFERFHRDHSNVRTRINTKRFVEEITGLYERTKDSYPWNTEIDVIKELNKINEICHQLFEILDARRSDEAGRRKGFSSNNLDQSDIDILDNRVQLSNQIQLILDKVIVKMPVASARICMTFSKGYRDMPGLFDPTNSYFYVGRYHSKVLSFIEI